MGVKIRFERLHALNLLKFPNVYMSSIILDSYMNVQSKCDLIYSIFYIVVFMRVGVDVYMLMWKIASNWGIAITIKRIKGFANLSSALLHIRYFLRFLLYFYNRLFLPSFWRWIWLRCHICQVLERFRWDVSWLWMGLLNVCCKGCVCFVIKRG